MVSKETVVGYFKELLSICLGRLIKMYENLSQNVRYLGLASNTGPPILEAEVLTTSPRRWVRKLLMMRKKLCTVEEAPCTV